MRPNKKWIDYDTHLGDEVLVDDQFGNEMVVTPESKSITIQLPMGGFVWNRPTAVILTNGDQSERIAVINKTRLLQISFWGLAIFTSALFLIRALCTRRM